MDWLTRAPTRRSWRLRLAFVAAVATAATSSGCGGKTDKSGLLSTADVQEAFAHEGMTLVVDEDKAPWVHFLWYGTAGTQSGEHIAIFVYDEPAGAADARVDAPMRARSAGVSRVLVAKNVEVILLRLATADERRRALLAVTALKHK